MNASFKFSLLRAYVFFLNYMSYFLCVGRKTKALRKGILVDIKDDINFMDIPHSSYSRLDSSMNITLMIVMKMIAWMVLFLVMRMSGMMNKVNSLFWKLLYVFWIVWMIYKIIIMFVWIEFGFGFSYGVVWFYLSFIVLLKLDVFCFIWNVSRLTSRLTGGKTPQLKP